MSVLNYMVTSNHIHLLVRDSGPNVISQSMQLIAGRTAQEYNQRKKRQGAFWEDRYHATAVEADEHLHRCLVYIDLNMIRAGAVSHPDEWKHSGYHAIQEPPERYGVIDLQGLSTLCGFAQVGEFQQVHRQWVEKALAGEPARDDRWSEAIAVGGLAFVEKVKSDLGYKALHREALQAGEAYMLQEGNEAYAGKFTSRSDALSVKNMIPWDENTETAET